MCRKWLIALFGNSQGEVEGQHFYQATQNGARTAIVFARQSQNSNQNRNLPACTRLLFPLLHAEKGSLRNAVANRVTASRWQGILFLINCEIISGQK